MAGEAAELVLQCCSRQRSGPEKDVCAQRCVCLAGAHPAVTGCPTNCSVIAPAAWRLGHLLRLITTAVKGPAAKTLTKQHFSWHNSAIRLCKKEVHNILRIILVIQHRIILWIHFTLPHWIYYKTTKTLKEIVHNI